MSRIPKIIHYCWVGGKPKPPSVLYCIESWKKYCPDYEIIEWNENNYDFSKNNYMKSAYEEKKWGFVPDYARLDIVYEHGGIYLDTDVEVIKNLDPLLENKAFMGFENTGEGTFYVNCGHGFGAIPHHPIIKAARDLYEGLSFYNDDGSLNIIASPHYTTESLLAFGLAQENKDQDLPDMKVYASDVLCPKNFTTGKIKKTRRTVSIHHFTASWVDESIKKELKHQQKIKGIFGDKIGSKVLVLESVFQKYPGYKLPLEVIKRIYKYLKALLIKLKDKCVYYFYLVTGMFVSNGNGHFVFLDPSIDSGNCGDGIIIEACKNQLTNLIDVSSAKRLPTQRRITRQERKELAKASYKILCGTNILSGHLREYQLWKTTPDMHCYKNMILMGIGFSSKSTDSDFYTRCLLHQILDKKYIHSVRDSFSEKMLKSMGIKNVVNTSCPTMWNLTKEFCNQIPRDKGKNVIMTITDYNRSYEQDQMLFDILLANYKKVYFWVQGQDDRSYLKELKRDSQVIIIDSGVSNYKKILEDKDLDYVGTRLHAGILALNYHHRSIIISIDNRAECIAKDTNLPIIKRNDIQKLLENKINSSFETMIHLPEENIKLWKAQFKNK